MCLNVLYLPIVVKTFVPFMKYDPNPDTLTVYNVYTTYYVHVRI